MIIMKGLSQLPVSRVELDRIQEVKGMIRHVLLGFRALVQGSSVGRGNRVVAVQGNNRGMASLSRVERGEKPTSIAKVAPAETGWMVGTDEGGVYRTADRVRRCD